MKFKRTVLFRFYSYIRDRIMEAIYAVLPGSSNSLASRSVHRFLSFVTVPGLKGYWHYINSLPVLRRIRSYFDPAKAERAADDHAGFRRFYLVQGIWLVLAFMLLYYPGVLLQLFQLFTFPLQALLAAWLPIDFDNLWRSFRNIAQLSNVGGITILVFLALRSLSRILGWLARQRYRFLVTLFEARSATPSEDLTAIANLLTHSVISELEKIAKLIYRTDVASSNSIRIDSDDFKLIMTSGLDVKLLQQLRPLKNMELRTPQLKVSLGFINVLAQRFAKMQLSGVVQVRENNVVEVRVEMSQSRGLRPVVSQFSGLPYYSTNKFTNSEVQRIARRIAVDLVMQLGQENRFFRRKESLDAFLSGLEATKNEKWWLAIARFQETIAIEETHANAFGIGHYLLGAALIAIGNFEDGFRHLRTAKANGLANKEVDYYLALTTLFRSWNKIHERDDEFHEIVNLCNSALKADNKFSYANHLLAMTYYMRARLFEREYSRRYGDGRDQELQEKYADYYYLYNNAKDKLKEAIAQVESREPDREMIMGRDTVHEEVLIMRHQLGDALRGMRRYNEAIWNYDEVLKYRPNNLRTLVDKAKSQCLGGRWSAVESGLAQELPRLPRCQWDADAHIYVGWHFAGRAVKESDMRLLGKSLQHLDFAIQQRPRYLTRWVQNDWLAEVEALLPAQSDENPDSPLRRIFDSRQHFDASHEDFSSFVFFWLGWRSLLARYKGESIGEDGKLTVGKSNTLDESKVCQGFSLEKFDAILSSKDFANERLSRLWKEGRPFLALLSRLISRNFDKSALFLDDDSWGNIIVSDEELDETCKLLRIFKRVEKDFYVVSKPKDQKFKQPIYQETLNTLNKGSKSRSPASDSGKLDGQVNFAERWAIDFFAEISCLTCKMLTRLGDYQEVIEVSRSASRILQSWTELWLKVHPETGDGGFKFSPYVMRYQLASLYAWHAYAIWKVSDTIEGRFQQVMSSDDKIEYTSSPGRALKEAEEALRIYTMHPLAVFVKASICGNQKRYQLAISLLTSLYMNIEPFDPSRTIVRPARHGKRLDPDDPFRKRLFKVEKLTGRQRFTEFLSPNIIQTELARLYSEMGEDQQSVEHLGKGLLLTPRSDLKVDNFLVFANRLKNLELFDEAQAVLNSFELLSKTPIVDVKISKEEAQSLTVAQCLLLTRKALFEQAHALAMNTSRKFFFPAPKGLEAGLLDELWQRFPDIQSFFKAKAKDLQGEYQGYLQRFILAKIPKQKGYDGKNSLSVYHRQPNVQNIVMAKLRSNAFKSSTRTKIKANIAIPRIFAKLKADHDDCDNFKLNLLLSMIAITLSRTPERMDVNKQSIQENYVADLLEEKYADKLNDKENKLRMVRESREIIEGCSFALENVIRFADLCNALAYSKAQQDLRLDLALEDANYAAVIMRMLIDNIDKELQPRLYRRLSRKMAAYYDTICWVHYRANNAFAYLGMKPEFGALPEAITFGELSLKYEQRLSIVQYHLGRTYMTLLENTWQTIEDPSEKNFADFAPLIDKHLRKSLRYWRNARRLDKSDRLITQLSWLGKRISKYQANWDQVQNNSIRSARSNRRNDSSD